MAKVPDAQGILLLCPLPGLRLLLVGGEKRANQLPLDAGQQLRPPPQGRLVVCHPAETEKKGCCMRLNKQVNNLSAQTSKIMNFKIEKKEWTKDYNGLMN
jgi:hypothetical protein